MDEKQRKRRRQQRRRRRIVLCAVLLFLTAVLVLLLFLLLRGKGNAGSPSVSSAPAVASAGTVSAGTVSAGTISAGTSSVSSSVPAVSSPERISFSEEDMHTGDLILVSADYAYDFDANAASLDLVKIKSAQTYAYAVSKDEFQLASRVMPYLDAMMKACDEAVGRKDTSISSAYRTKEYQQKVWDEAKEQYGEAYAKQYVAAPGYSEHHTGLAVDLGIIYEDGTEGSFSESDNAKWAAENCAKYGFVRRYQEDKASITKISNEAWHFRYVGVPHATYMTEKNLCLEEYLDYLRKKTSRDAPLVITCSTGTFHVFFTSAASIEKPAGSYEVSGNNVDGWIVTEKV